MATRNVRFDLTEWNGRQLGVRSAVILQRFLPIIDKQFKEDIQKPQFTWTGRITIRSTGEEVGSPRNIVDTGAFLASQRATTKSDATGSELVFTWGNAAVNYAGRILEGDGSNYPPRDWIAVALKNQPFRQFFAREWQRLERKGI